MIRRALRTRRAVVSAVVAALAVVGLWALPNAFAQNDEEVAEAETEASDAIDQAALRRPWVDPIVQFDLQTLPLASEQWFDFTVLHQSDIFEDGVGNIGVNETFDVSTETERHLRALQAVATVEDAIWNLGQEINAADASIASASSEITASRNQIEQIDEQILNAQTDIDDVVAADDAEIAEQARLWDEINNVNGAVAELAIQAFIGESSPLETFLEDPQSSEHSELRVVTDQLRDLQRDDIEVLQGEIRESEERREVLAEELAPYLEIKDGFQAQQAVLQTRIDELIAERRTLRSTVSELEDGQAPLEESLEETEAFTEVTALQYQAAYHQRLTGFVAGTNIPLVALNAYVRAARTLEVESPSCGIHWSQLAGIGRIESIHGNFGESTLDFDGHTTVDILGIALNGRNNTMLIRDTDDGELDGDRIYDRALGPMQFIPTTWDLYGADGNGDGESDPQNVYDATLAAARYLCAAPGTMLTHTGEQAAYWAYNHDLEYSRNVTNAGRSYHDQLNVTPESAAFAAFAALPTLEEQIAIEEAERLAAEELAAEEAAAEELAAEAGEGEEVDGDGGDDDDVPRSVGGSDQ